MRIVIMMHYLWGLRSWSQSSQNIMFLSLYRITIMIAILFIRTVIMIILFTKMSYIWVFMRIVTMIAVWWSQSSQNTLFFFIRIACDLTKCPIFESVLTENCDHESQFSYQYHHHQQTPVHWHRMILMLFRSKHKQISSRIRTNELCKRLILKTIFMGSAPDPLPTPILTWPRRSTRE